MPSLGLDVLVAEVAALQVVRPIGRIATLGAGVVRVSGLSNCAALGDIVLLPGSAAGRGEVLSLDADDVTVLPDGPMDGLRIGAEVQLEGPYAISPHDSWIGRVVDPFGMPLDKGPMLRGPTPRAVRSAPPPAADRRPLGPRLNTGLAVFDTLLPIVRGQRVGLFAGSGVGKSTLLGRLALGLSADVIVIALVGERGRELRDFVDRVLGPEGMARSVVVAATSDMSPMARRRCAWTAMAVAEHFRDAGRQVLLLADSVTRFAEAHREVALAAGEPATLGGFPPSMAQMITALCERAGPGTEISGDITAIFTVLVAGSNMEGPVADTLRGVLDGHVVLDRGIAERGRFPAIDLLRSVSRALPDCADATENALIAAARKAIGTYERSEMMIQAGLYAKGSDPDVDEAIRLHPRLDRFLTETASGGAVVSFAKLSACLGPSEPPDGG